MLGSKNGQHGTLCIRKHQCDYILPLLLSIVHMATNADFLVLGSNVFYVKGTTGESFLQTLLALQNNSESARTIIGKKHLICGWDASPCASVHMDAACFFFGAVRVMALYLSQNGLLGRRCGRLQPSIP